MISNIPIAHIHGGEKTEGAFDESIRHSITKMSHLHFTATEDYKNRVIQLGEHPSRVFNVGGMGIENIKRLRQIDNYGQIKIDNTTLYDFERKVIIRDKEEFTLSKIESKILEYFLKNKNKTLSIDEISVNNWIYEEMPESTTIRTYIKNLRKKLNEDTITTLKGIGYRFNIDNI